jgi:hypothetical protein
MTTPHVSPTDGMPTHDFALSDGTNIYGFQYAKSPFEGYQESLFSGGSKVFKVVQNTFTSGRGKTDFNDDNNGYVDSNNAWTMTDQALFPTLQYHFAKGLVSKEDLLPGTITPISDGKRYHSETFVPTSTIATDQFITTGIWACSTNPSGSTATVAICIDDIDTPGNPGAQVGTMSLTIPYGTTPVFCSVPVYIAIYPLNAGTTYHLKITGPATYYVSLGSLSGGGLGQSSSNGSSWTNETYSIYFSLAPVISSMSRKWYHFYMSGADYVVSANDDNSAPLLFINGDKFLATGESGSVMTTITCTGKTWGTTKFVGAKVRIVDGKGDGQIRTIISHTNTVLTVAAWDVQPDNTSIAVIYATDWWTPITSPAHGLTVALTGPVCVTGGVAYFPQGDAVAMRRMTFTAGAHAFAADGSNKYDLLDLTASTGGIQQVAGFVSGTATIAVAPTVAWGTDLTFAASKQLGSSDFKINGTVNYSGTLNAFKENGMFRINNAVPQEIDVGGLRSSPNTSNGQFSCVQNLWLYFTRANSVVQEQGDSAADIENFRVGYEPLPVLRRGPGGVISAEGWIFRWIDAGSLGESSVLAWNGYGWHEVLRGYGTGQRIRGCFWQPCPDTRARLWTDIGGDLVYQEFPQYGSNPLRDTNCTFQNEFTFTTGTIDLGEPTFYKFFKDIQFITRNLSATSTITVDYQVDNNVGTDTWTALSTVIDSSPFHSANIELGGVFQIRFRFRVSSASNTTPPIIDSWTVNGNVIEPQKYQWSMTCRVESDGEDLQGATDTNPDTLDTWLKDCAARRVKLTTLSQKTSFHGKVVTVEAQTVRMSMIDTDEGSSKWTGMIWFNVREG